MATILPKALVIFCFNLCASLYIGVGTYGATLEMNPRLLDALPAWSSLAAAAAALLLIRGICYFGHLWDKILAKEAAILKRKEDAKKR
ncbi:MAG: hypothetical protein M1550_07475 [Deltaproteobacteria bacterium]|nr:hypothetical protein [Deltaproteobacteria bacterium]